MLVELDDKNELHAAAKRKILEFANDPKRSPFTRTAERDLSLTPVTTIGVRQGICCHIKAGATIYLDRLDSGETAYVLKECRIESEILYIKLKFCKLRGQEEMLIISAHPPRRW